MSGAVSTRTRLLALAIGGIAAGGPAVAMAARPPVVTLAPYPVAAPAPVGDSLLPLFVDDDELVRAQLNRDGSVATMVDDLKIKINGGGDYALHLPGQVLAVSNQGGDSVPGLAGQRDLEGEAEVQYSAHAAGAELVSRLVGGGGTPGRRPGHLP